MNETVKGPLFIIEQTAVMIGLWFKKKKKISLDNHIATSQEKEKLSPVIL